MSLFLVIIIVSPLRPFGKVFIFNLKLRHSAIKIFSELNNRYRQHTILSFVDCFLLLKEEKIFPSRKLINYFYIIDQSKWHFFVDVYNLALVTLLLSMWEMRQVPFYLKTHLVLTTESGEGCIFVNIKDRDLLSLKWFQTV